MVIYVKTNDDKKKKKMNKKKNNKFVVELKCAYNTQHTTHLSISMYNTLKTHIIVNNQQYNNISTTTTTHTHTPPN